MTKPSSVPTWATDAAAQIATPPAGKQAIGWQPAEPLPAQHLNWLFKAIIEWLPWLRDFESTGHTWPALQRLNGEAGDTNPAVVFDGPITTRKLVHEWQSLSHAIRLYITAASTLELVTNARWDGSTWIMEETSWAAASRLRLSRDGLRLSVFDGTGNFLDTAWNDVVSLPDDGYLKILNPGTLSNPSFATPQRNKLCAMNITKVWATCEFYGQSPVTFKVKDGFNVDSLTSSPTNANWFRLVFASPMTGNNYAVSGSSGILADGKSAFIVVCAKAEGYLDFVLVDTDNVPRGAMSGETLLFDIHIDGKQA